MVWWEKHRDKAVKTAELHDEVRSLVDPHGRGRQYLASKVGFRRTRLRVSCSNGKGYGQRG
jgi:hypothetical protein